MASDTYIITQIRGQHPGQALWRVRPTTAVGPTDIASTRSFVLSAVANETGLFGDEDTTASAFYALNVGKYIAIAEVVGSVTHSIEEWPPNTDELLKDASGLPAREREDKLAETLPFFVLHIELEDPSLLDGLPGVFGTTAFDWWHDDPETRPINRHFWSSKELEIWSMAKLTPAVDAPMSCALLSHLESTTSSTKRLELYCDPLDGRMAVIAKGKSTSCAMVESFDISGTYFEALEVLARPEFLSSCCVTRSGAIVMTSANGAYWFQDGKDRSIEKIDTKSNLKRGSVLGVKRRGDEVWIATNNRFNLVEEGEVRRAVKVPKEFGSFTLFRMFDLSEDAFWLAGKSGVLRIRGKKTDHVPVPVRFLNRLVSIDDERVLISGWMPSTTWLWQVGEDPVLVKDGARAVGLVHLGDATFVAFSDGRVARWTGEVFTSERLCLNETMQEITGCTLFDGDLILFGVKRLVRVSAAALLELG